MNENSLLKISLLLLNIVGVNPVNQNIWAKSRALTGLLLYGYLTFEVLMELVMNWKGLDSISNLVLFAAMYQVLSKIFALIINRKKINNVLRTMEAFYHINNPEDCNEVQEEIKTFYNSTKRLMIFQIITTFLAMFIILALPLILNRLELPVKTYHPNDLHKSRDYILMYILQLFIATTTAIYYNLGFDCLFTTFIVCIFCEFKIIKAKICLIEFNTEENDEDEILEYLNQLIYQHDVLLCFLKDVDGIYSKVMLNQFISGSVCTYICLAGMVAQGFPIEISGFSKLLMVGCIFLGHLLIYSIGGTILIDQCESVAHVVFDLEWYTKTYPKLRRSLVLMIQRCQRVQKITTGGVFDLNLNILAKIAKFGLFCFAMLQEILYKKNDC